MVSFLNTMAKLKDVSQQKQCAGKGCENEGKIVLAIQYLKRTGHFCESCAEDLLSLGLVLDKRVASNLLADTDPDIFAADGSKYKSRLYCIGCWKFIEAEVRYDTNDYPIVHHNDGRIHRVIFQNDIQFLLDTCHFTAWGQSARYEIAEMYGLSVQETRSGVRKCRRRSLDCHWKITSEKDATINGNSSPYTETISSDVLIQLYRCWI